MTLPIGQRLVVVSNRLPIVVEREGDELQVSSATGGLVTALSPVLRRGNGLWIGWPGPEGLAAHPELLATLRREQGFEMCPVDVPPEEFEPYYSGFSNGCLWPLFHDQLGRAVFDRGHFEAYRGVNERFAEVVSDNVRPGDLLWIHDYHLLLVGRFLRERGCAVPLAFFLHIPFPNADLFRRLPWRDAILDALLAYDVLGFQTPLDRRNFTRTLKVLRPEVRLAMRGRHALIRAGGRLSLAGSFPISIDFDEFDGLARSPEATVLAAELQQAYGARRLVLGLDRLDYTKGMPERFLAFERLLENVPAWRDEVTLIQVVVPSRTDTAAYQSLKEQLDGLVGRINGRFSRPGGVAIHYFFRHLTRLELVAHYRACEVAFVTPLRDGMNLVAKEYCAATVDGNGVLVLSEFAGTAETLGRWAVLVNPYDVEGTAEGLHRALSMDLPARQLTMRRLRTEVRRNSVYGWVDRFGSALREWQAVAPADYPGITWR